MLTFKHILSLSLSAQIIRNLPYSHLPGFFRIILYKSYNKRKRRARQKNKKRKKEKKNLLL